MSALEARLAALEETVAALAIRVAEDLYRRQERAAEDFRLADSVAKLGERGVPETAHDAALVEWEKVRDAEIAKKRAQFHSLTV